MSARSHLLVIPGVCWSSASLAFLLLISMFSQGLWGEAKGRGALTSPWYCPLLSVPCLAYPPIVFVFSQCSLSYAADTLAAESQGRQEVGMVGPEGLLLLG